MSDAFDTVCLPFVLKEEGGYVDDPRDPGGATNMGVTLKVLSAWRGRIVSKAEVKALTRDEAAQIYRAHYWTPPHCDRMPRSIALMVFDCSVNSGVSRSVTLLQGVLGLVQDGVVGPKTLAAVNAAPAVQTVEALGEARLRFLRGLPTWSAFGEGWINRVKAAVAAANALT